MDKQDALDGISSITAMEKDYFSVISQIFYYLTFLLGVPGNVFVVYIAGMKMKRTVNTIWFLNLAIADLLCCFSTLCNIILYFIDHWPFGSVMCKILPLVIHVNMFASVFTLSLISLDRFTQVITPVWAKNHRSLLLARLSCVVAWVLAIALNVPFVILRRTFIYNNKTYCIAFGHNDFETFGKLCVISFVFGFLIPLICITTCYGFIARKLGRSRFHSGRAFRIMSAVIVAFFLCWLPYHTVLLVRMFGVNQSIMVARRLIPLVVSLAYFNSCLNPVLYFFIGQDIKEKFKLSIKLKHVFERAFSEEGTQIPQSTEAQQMQSL
ncbi:C3a anaphylatoxin chemotactic receptor-like [Myxocyprinus asiaticus]|uniref:C3a anaphylatoxin chemotactic receptor-like n=1 Tax=Myxocyprinus asiaticus TaxID=70543 RepID=UPI002222A172|nr:C3a anaphylatoxin chemotactic receptor-like [Myxocyprinus asiaticus]